MVIESLSKAMKTNCQICLLIFQGVLQVCWAPIQRQFDLPCYARLFSNSHWLMEGEFIWLLSLGFWTSFIYLVTSFKIPSRRKNTPCAIFLFYLKNKRLCWQKMKTNSKLNCGSWFVLVAKYKPKSAQAIWFCRLWITATIYSDFKLF